MSPFEYALGLISILMSLALAHIVIGFHRLLRRAKTVVWDARLVTAAALVIVEVIRIWFATWTVRDVEAALSFPVYFAMFGHILLLVMTALACLPDEVGEGCDLSQFYDGNRRYFWCAFASAQLAYFLLWLLFGGSQSSVGDPVGWQDWARILGPLAVFLILAFVRKRWLDYSLPLAIIAFYFWRYWHQTLIS